VINIASLQGGSGCTDHRPVETVAVGESRGTSDETDGEHNKSRHQRNAGDAARRRAKIPHGPSSASYETIGRSVQ
jgi:hypothetical protein